MGQTPWTTVGERSIGMAYFRRAPLTVLPPAVERM